MDVSSFDHATTEKNSTLRVCITLVTIAAMNLMSRSFSWNGLGHTIDCPMPLLVHMLPTKKSSKHEYDVVYDSLFVIRRNASMHCTVYICMHI